MPGLEFIIRFPPVPLKRSAVAVQSREEFLGSSSSLSLAAGTSMGESRFNLAEDEGVSTTCGIQVEGYEFSTQECVSIGEYECRCYHFSNFGLLFGSSNEVLLLLFLISLALFLNFPNVFQSIEVYMKTNTPTLLFLQSFFLSFPSSRSSVIVTDFFAYPFLPGLD